MKNLELKKMSLANIENRLTPAEMENVMAGSMPSAECMADAGLSAVVGGMIGGPWGYFGGLAWGYYMSPRC